MQFAAILAPASHVFGKDVVGVRHDRAYGVRIVLVAPFLIELLGTSRLGSLLGTFFTATWIAGSQPGQLRGRHDCPLSVETRSRQVPKRLKICGRMGGSGPGQWGSRRPLAEAAARATIRSHPVPSHDALPVS